MEGADRSAGWDLSLLNPTNRAAASRVLSNIRLACNGGGTQVRSRLYLGYIYLSNIRLACNGGGTQVAVLSDDAIDEVAALLERRHRSPPHVISRAR